MELYSKKAVKYLFFYIIITNSCLPIFLVSADIPIQLVSWKRNYDYFGYYDLPISVQKTLDGGYVILGRAQGMAGCSYIIVKTDSEGEHVWTASWGGDFHVYCVGECVYETEDQSFIFLGFN